VNLEFGDRSLILHRVPEDPDLRAWDQADLYALSELRERGCEGRVLLVLDAFGALACALADRDRASAGDSELAHIALASNQSANSIADACPWTDLDSISGEFDCAIVKVPRQKGLLDAALARIRPHLTAAATVIGAGMTKHVHNSTIKSFERWIGPTTTSLARSRARLLLASVEVEAKDPLPPMESSVPGEEFKLWLEPGVFAKKGVDEGSALLLPWVPRLADDGRHQVIADAGSGSGLLAAAAAERNPQARIIATDESYLAVNSSRLTFESAGFKNAEARVANILDGVADGSVDLVISNPPQHQAAALSQTSLARFIDEAARVLRPQGRLRMVANRHVNLNVALRDAFARTRILDQDRKYMVCEAESPLSAEPRTD
jgi:16S rRNA G1207 methylase RsmC